MKIKILSYILKILFSSFLITLSAGWADESKTPTSDSLSYYLEQAMYVDPEAIADIQNRYRTFIKLFDKKRSEERQTTGDELIEIGKIIGMGVVAAILYGVIHDLITTQIDFSYFSNLYFTHHGVYTARHFPFVYNSESRVLYALLWGTIATWWVGLPIGGLSALSARISSNAPKNAPKMDWRDFVYPVAILLGANLAIALATGGATYLTSGGNSLDTVAAMHNSSYLFGILGGVLLPQYVYSSRLKETSTALKQCACFTKDVMRLFNEHPKNTKIQDLIKLHMNSPYGNCMQTM